MKLKSLMKELNKIKKKVDDVPVLYVYGTKAEMTFVEISKVFLLYSSEPIEHITEKHFTTVEEFLKLDFSFEEKEGYHPFVVITEEI